MKVVTAAFAIAMTMHVVVQAQPSPRFKPPKGFGVQYGPPERPARRSPFFAPTIAGAAMLGAGYIASIAVVAVDAASADDHDESLDFLLIPIAGPFVTFATIDAEVGWRALLMIDGIVQTAGLVTLAVGAGGLAYDCPAETTAVIEVGPFGTRLRVQY